MNRAKFNFIVDLIGFMNLLCLAFTGSIIKFILPPGSGGRGPGEIKELWSMTRHE
jgi:hypothetical protein